MAEIVVTSVVTVLFEKLISSDLLKLTGSEGIKSQLEKLKTKWTYIEAVLADASEKHITQESVKVWLLDLHRLAYDIEDVLDDMATETLRRKLNDESSTGKVLKKIIPTFCTNFTPHNLMYGRKMRSMLDEFTEKLNGVYENKNMLGVDINTILALRSNRNFERTEETSLLDHESPVLGREKDEAALLEKLLGDESRNQNVSVVSIVGFGGVGKTTLARLVYNNQKVKDYFELRVWVCVSNEFDVLAVSKAIYQAVTKEDSTHATLNPLHEALKEKLSNKRFLLVLDDVWNEDHQKWKDVEKPLKGAPGSKIIVTTRKITVASAMDSVERHNLGLLSDEDALSLLAKSSIDEHKFDNHPSLILVAQLINEKCKGLPLALIAIGRVLKGKGYDEYEWDKLLKSEIWSSDDGGTDILPALKLSYYDLPLHLKKVFAYCSLFRKDYLFNKNKLVLLWMAEGFLSQSIGRKDTMESLGHQYFEVLLSKSFFQHSPIKKSRYIMHDLMNDLAISVAGEFFFMLDGKMIVHGRNEDFDKIRHFSFLDQVDEEFINFKELHKSRRLRTFLSMLDNWLYVNKLDHVLIKLLPRLQLLRVLSINSVGKVPQSIGGLKHLRYLNFSKTDIEELPEQVGELYNLQTLLVCKCSELFRLPVSFAKLINLRHLDMSYTPSLNNTPLGIGGLTSLQTLTKVFIKRANGFKISDLEGVVNLEGHLSIYGLENVADSQQAIDANLEGKKGLVSLEMEWGDEFDDSRNFQTEYEVIERLRPPSKLNKLKILNFGGMEFPSWFATPSFDKLTELTIKGCANCTHFNGIAFPLLEYLKVSDMEGLEKWSDCDGDKTTGSVPRSLPRVREIHIENCLKLAEVSIGLIPSLEVLVIKKCSEVVVRAMIVAFPAIKNLAIYDIENLTELDVEVLKHLEAVEMLKIDFCYELKEVNFGSSNAKSVLRDVYLYRCSSLESYNCPNTIEELVISYCDSVTSLALSLPSSLKVLRITNCHNLESISDDLPSSLEVLKIWYCKNLKSFPHAYLQRFTSLKDMTISYCPSMDDTFPSGLWPPNLRKLEIGVLKKPMSKWGLQNYPTSLVELELYGDSSGVTSFAMEGDAMNTASTSFHLPPSLTSLHIWSFKDVESISKELLQHLTHLQSLKLYYCLNIRDVPQSTSSLTNKNVVR
ncbi:putative disease resistance RPP13-like protein 1 [Rutidosis leptorrhynchoides]|uniref:putative disease resistance RPP13-like protein 1 n=1 Tax=Rutidosis leptorrhynchoides TaxID=125765 RepID=UPI003A9A3784